MKNKASSVPKACFWILHLTSMFTRYTRRKRCVQVDPGDRLTSHIEKPPQPISHSMTRLWGTRNLVHVSEISPWVILINQWFVVFFLELGTWAKRNDLGNPLSLGKIVDRWIVGSDLKTQLVAADPEDWGPPIFHFWNGLEGVFALWPTKKKQCTTRVNLSKFTIDVNTSCLIPYGYFNDNNHCCRSRESLQRIVGGDCIFQNPAQPKVGSPNSPQSPQLRSCYGYSRPISIMLQDNSMAFLKCQKCQLPAEIQQFLHMFLPLRSNPDFLLSEIFGLCPQKKLLRSPPKMGRKKFRSGPASELGENTITDSSPASKRWGNVCLFFEIRWRIQDIPSRELTYPPKMAFWRWFSFSQGGIC